MWVCFFFVLPAMMLWSAVVLRSQFLLYAFVLERAHSARSTLALTLSHTRVHTHTPFSASARSSQPTHTRAQTHTHTKWRAIPWIILCKAIIAQSTARDPRSADKRNRTLLFQVQEANPERTIASRVANVRYCNNIFLCEFAIYLFRVNRALAKTGQLTRNPNGGKWAHTSQDQRNRKNKKNQTLHKKQFDEGL